MHKLCSHYRDNVPEPQNPRATELQSDRDPESQNPGATELQSDRDREPQNYRASVSSRERPIINNQLLIIIG